MTSLKIATWNVCLGAFHKINLIKDHINREKLDILMLNEAEISVSHDLNLFKISGFELVTPNNRNVTRIAAYIRDDIKFVLNQTNPNLDTISLTIGEYKILGVYRGFKLSTHATFTDQINDLRNEIADHNIIIGDLNLDHNKRDISSYRFSNIYGIWSEEINAKDLIQVNNQNTWSRTVAGELQESCLDHIYLRTDIVDFEIFQKVTTSDHDLIGLKIGSVNITHSKSAEFYVRRWKSYNKDLVVQECSKISWENFDKMNSQDMCDYMDLNLSRLVEKITPTIKVKSRSRKYLWNNKIAKLLTTKQTLKRRFRRNKTVALAERIKNTDEKIKKEANDDVRAKIRSTIIPGDYKSFWKAVNISQNKGDFTQQAEIKNGVLIARTNAEKAQLFANFFEEKVSTLRNTAEIKPCYNGTPNDVIPDENFFTLELITKVLKNTKPSQCSGYDRIPMVYLRDSCEIISHFVHQLFTKIYNEKTVPEQWKMGKITPIPKKGRQTDVKNYRPITSLCSLAKVFERCILIKLTSLKDFTGTNQHGFKKGHSTSTALLHLQNIIATSLDNNHYHGVISLDLSAAFDLVNPELLVQRMTTAGVPNDITQLIHNWLTNRRAYVEIGGECSDQFNVSEGTVQGSVLGPVLFAIFVAPMFELADVSSFADDSYLSESGPDLNDVINRLKTKTELLVKWFKDSGMVVNENKTEFCVFHRTKKEVRNMRINDVIISSQPTIKALGVILDSNLNWEPHVINVRRTCEKTNMGFNILKKYFTRDELITLATSMYYSKMYYAAEVWLLPTLSVKLQRILLHCSAKVLKTITGIKCNEIDHTSYYDLHKLTNRGTPTMMTSYVQATCLYRILHSQTPESIFLDLLTKHIESRRHYKPMFVKNNWHRVGDNIFSNRIQKTCSSLSCDLTLLSINQLKIQAKKDFLTF